MPDRAGDNNLIDGRFADFTLYRARAAPLAILLRKELVLRQYYCHNSLMEIVRSELVASKFKLTFPKDPFGNTPEEAF